MNREISTVHDLWREWSIGLGTGPSVKSLEEAWGPRWRQTPTETRFFNRRRIIIDEVNRLVKESGVTVEEAVRSLDGKIQESTKSLNWLQKQISLRSANKTS